jgi:hypothetical protein
MGEVVGYKDSQVKEGNQGQDQPGCRKGGDAASASQGQQPGCYANVEDEGKSEIPQRGMEHGRKVIKGAETHRPDQVANPETDQ